MELYTNSTKSIILSSVSIFNPTGATGTFGLGRPVVIGQTPSSPILGLSEDDGTLTTATANIATAWGVAPTSPSQFFRQCDLPAVTGSGIIWTFPRGIVIPCQNSLVIWNQASNPVVDIYLVWYE